MSQSLESPHCVHALIMLMVRSFIVASCMLFSLCASTQAQVSSSPNAFQPLPELSFRWRLLGREDASEKYQIEMLFENVSDSAIVFNYVIKTNKEEELDGRMTLQPKGKQFFGWALAGSRIISASTNSVEIRKAITPTSSPGQFRR